MTAQNGYVPPAYVPLGQSDAEPEVVQPKEERYVPHHVGDGPARWSSGICACCDDMPSCLIGCLCPCYLFGKNAEFLGSGTLIGSCMTHFILWSVVNTVCCCISDGILLGIPGCFVACYACAYRKGLREKYKLEVRLMYVLISELESNMIITRFIWCRRPLATILLPTSSAIYVLTVKSIGRSERGLATLTHMI
ncbi:Protein PLANT CADMIUM RESISTANCE 10 [Linum grandiflorum]